MARTIISIIFLGAALMVFFNWTSPSFDEIKILREQEESFNSALKSSKELKDSIGEILSEYNSISKDDRDRLNQLLPNRMDAINLIIEIDNLAGAQGLILKKIDVQKPQTGQKSSFGSEKKYFEKIPISMTLAGPYGPFTSFLGQLEKSLSLIDINQLTFSSGKINSYEFNIRAYTYWKK